MSSTLLRIQFPEDFEEQYEKYKKSLGISKTPDLKPDPAQIRSAEERDRRVERVSASAVSKRQKVVERAAKNEPDGILYNPETGVGKIDGRTFKIKPTDPAFPVFAGLYAVMNKPMDRQSVLINSGFYEEGQSPDPARRTSETAHINDIAKTIRRILKVDTTQLINNDGNLTLVGTKLKFPKNNQTSPK